MKHRKEKAKPTLNDWLKLGGEAQLRRWAIGEIFEVSGPSRERSTGAGYVTFVPPVLDPRIGLTPQQQVIGTCYGGFVEDVMTAGGSEWIREFVDTGRFGSGGVAEKRLLRMAMVRTAREALALEPAARYPVGTKRQRGKRGRHKPIPMLDLVDMACVSARPMSFIALSYGWTTERRAKSGGTPRTVVPDRQRKHITQCLADGLDVVSDAWAAAGFAPPGGLIGVEVQ